MRLLLRNDVVLAVDWSRNVCLIMLVKLYARIEFDLTLILAGINNFASAGDI